MEPVTLILLIAGLALTSFGMRGAFILGGRNIALPAGLQRALRFVPPAVFFALVVPELLYPPDGLSDGLKNSKLAAACIAGAVAWRTRNTLATIVTGMGVLYLLRHVLGG
jgi:branched-subunit amino acid transport protein